MILLPALVLQGPQPHLLATLGLSFTFCQMGTIILVLSIIQCEGASEGSKQGFGRVIMVHRQQLYGLKETGGVAKKLGLPTKG